MMSILGNNADRPRPHMLGVLGTSLSRGGTVVPNVPGDTYSVREDIDNIFGADSVTTWADLDNNGDANTIANRIVWARQLAYANVNTRLNGGPYAVPFVIDATLPKEITDAEARLAGCLLYESRGITDNTQNDTGRVTSSGQLTYHRRYVEIFFQQVLAGWKKFPGFELLRTNNFPVAGADANV